MRHANPILFFLLFICLNVTSGISGFSKCTSGEESFSMMLAKSEQAPSQLTIDKFKKQVPSFTVVSPGGHFNLRLDLCLGDKTRLDSVIYAIINLLRRIYQVLRGKMSLGEICMVWWA